MPVWLIYWEEMNRRLKRIFLDTNVLVTLAEGRSGYEQVQRLLQMGIDGSVENCASILTVANMNYLLQKRLGKVETERVLKTLSEMLSILSMDKKQFDAAFRIEGNDFEDKLQIACAEAYSCNYIITENIRDFSGTGIPAYTPVQFFNHLEMQKTER